MADNTIHELIKRSFESANKKSWTVVATLEIDGKNPDEALAWSEDGLAFRAYYDKNDVTDLSNQNNFQLPPAADLFSGPRAWVNLPGIEVANEKEANANALSQLAAGADGILFDVRGKELLNLDFLLNQIDWQYCSISFRTNTSNSISENLSKYIQQKKYDPSVLTGSIFWDDDNGKNNVSELPLADCKKIQSLGLVINASTPTKEISEALVKGVHLLDRLTGNGIDISIAIQQIAFSIPVSTNFFIEIAKLKALRILWFQVARAYGEEDYQPSNLHLHIRSEKWRDERYEPNANMLKSTIASLAAVLGGCNSITVYAEDDSSTMNRIARNISNVLREESYIDKVADATAGAYAIEKMVDEIAQASWLDFQQYLEYDRT
jgi:methylmalonyl-CoA mutase